MRRNVLRPPLAVYSLLGGMGTEILVLFLLVPIGFWIYDISRIVRKRDTIRHLTLLIVGIAFLSGLAIDSLLDGFHPMQGVIIGSVFYVLAYLVAWFVVSVIINRIAQNGGGRNAT